MSLKIARNSLSLALLSALAMPALAQEISVINFEKYPSKESFNAAMNENFPVGSSYPVLQSALKQAGAQEVKDPATPNHVFIYGKKSGMLYNTTETRWTVSVSTNDDKIRTLSTNYGLIGL